MLTMPTFCLCKRILNISLDMCPTLYLTLVMVTANHMVYSVLTSIILHDALAAFHQPMEFTQFCKPMASNHAITNS